MFITELTDVTKSRSAKVYAEDKNYLIEYFFNGSKVKTETSEYQESAISMARNWVNEAVVLKG